MKKFSQNKKLKLLGIPSSMDLASKKVSCTNGFLCEHLNKRGVVSSLVAPEISRFRDNLILAKNISFKKKKWLFKNRISHERAILKSRYLNKTLERIDLKEFNGALQIGSEFKIDSILKSKGIPLFSYHDNNILAFLKTPHGLPSRKLKSRINKIIEFEKEVYKGLDGIFTMTQFLKNVFVEDFSLPEEKVHVVGVGCNLNNILECDKEYNNRNILFVAKDSFVEKGGIDLLEAFKMVRKEMPDATLKIVGQELNLNQEGVEVVGFIDKNKPGGEDIIKDLYQEASLFVMPSYVEATGNVFLEAMAHKVPCIGANLSAMPEIIVDNNCGMVATPGDVKDLGTKMIEVLKDESALKEFGVNGRKAIESKYNWDVVCGKAINIMSQFTL